MTQVLRTIRNGITFSLIAAIDLNNWIFNKVMDIKTRVNEFLSIQLLTHPIRTLVVVIAAVVILTLLLVWIF